MMPFRFPSALRIAVCVAAAGAAPRAFAADACPTGVDLTPGIQHCSNNQTGKVGSFGWSIWSSGSGGCITPSGNTAAFKATWSNSGDFLARDGFQWDETKTYDQYGTLSADYAYTKTGTAGGYSYVGIYGWSNNPLIEFYIVDDWYGSTTFAPTAGGTLKGTFTADSGTYKVYTHQQVGQPSIHGNNATFMQYFSIRQTPRQCGHISLTQHFDEWKSLGLNLGKMYEAKLLIEVGGGSGSIDFSVGTMSSGQTAILPPRMRPGSARSGRIDMGAGESGILSLLAVDGTVLKAVRRDPAEGAVLSVGDVPQGVYLLRFQGKDGASGNRKLLLP
jgi:hypothetical protein